MSWFRRWFAALLIVAPLLLLGRLAHAEDLSGPWVWNVEGRNLMVIELASGADGRLSGTLKRPTFITTSGGGNGLSVSGVRGPVVTRTVETLGTSDGVTHIAAFDPDDPFGQSRREYLMGVGSTGGVELRSPIDNGLPPIPLIRPRPPLEVAADIDPEATYVTRPPAQASNIELAALFEADQAPRANPVATVDWYVISEQDRVRRARVRDLLDSGQINSADDYWRAAFIFQHGDRPEDYLLAHSLAVVSVALGKQDATWIAAATLDRYLHSIGRAQIYGTQFQTRDAETTQGDFDPDLIPDQVRRTSNVPTLAEQARSLVEMNTPLASGVE